MRDRVDLVGEGEGLELRIAVLFEECGENPLGVCRIRPEPAAINPTGIERREIDSGYFTYIVYGPKGDIASTTDELNPRAKRSAEFLLAATPERVQALVIELMILRKRALPERAIVEGSVWLYDDRIEYTISIDPTSGLWPLRAVGGRHTDLIHWHLSEQFFRAHFSWVRDP